MSIQAQYGRPSNRRVEKVRVGRNSGAHRIALFLLVSTRMYSSSPRRGLAEAACDHWIVTCEMRQKRKTRREISGRGRFRRNFKDDDSMQNQRAAVKACRPN
jgi:hypothetical protein